MTVRGKGQRGSGTSSINNNNNKKSGTPYSRGGGNNVTHSSDEQQQQTKEQQRLLLLQQQQQRESADPSPNRLLLLQPHQQPQQGSSSSSRSRRSTTMKIGIRDDASKSRTPNLNNTPLSRTRSGSRSSGGSSSPAGLHGRAAPHKTAVVAPAPSRFTPKATSLNRFGFRNSGSTVKSGDSTDSVNSILSDAQTVSDSNSNIFDLCGDDNNESTNRIGSDSTSAATCDDNSQFHCNQNQRLESLDSSPRVSATNDPRLSNDIVPKQAAPLPCSSSPGGDHPQSNRITAFTRQLPKPQVVTVKSVSPNKIRTPLCNSPKTHNALSNASLNKSKSPSVRSFVHTPIKSVIDQSPTARQQSANISARTARVSRDSESSSKSCAEPDSGLGSSSESDKIREEGETCTLDSSNVESSEDVSDAWLKKTREQQHQIGSSPTQRKSEGESMDIQFNGTSSFEVKRQSLEVGHQGQSDGAVQPKDIKASPPTIQLSQDKKKSDAGKDKRDNTITYGMARQKFAPYSRNRYGYGYQSGQSRTAGASYSVSPAGSVTSGSGSPSPIVTKIPGSSGLVRSRVAMIETPQTKRTQQPSSVLGKTQLKKPPVRPTSLEKTPILVMPASEKTVELSTPVCRKLEYSENVVTPLKGDAQRDLSSSSSSSSSPWEGEGPQEAGKDLVHHLSQQPLVQDILIVGSVEVETQKDSCNVIVEADHYGSFYENSYDKGNPPPSSLLDRHQATFTEFKGNPDFGIRISESKAYKDVSENEKKPSGEVEEEKLIAKERDVASNARKVIEMCKSPVAADFAETAETNKDSAVETPDDSGIKLLSPQSESSFEILESLSETVDLTAEEEVEKGKRKKKDEEEEGYAQSGASTADPLEEGSVAKTLALLSSVSSGLEDKKGPSSLDRPSAAETTAATTITLADDKEPKPYLRPKPIPKTAECGPSIVCSNSQATKAEHSQDHKSKNNMLPSTDRCEKSQAALTTSSPSTPPLPMGKSSANMRSSTESLAIMRSSTESSANMRSSTESSANVRSSTESSANVRSSTESSANMRSSMESSVESHKSVSAASVLTDSGEHSNLSGKCTPTLNTGRSGDLDQDFLIDDEIADQPGLMFGGGSNMASSFFGDDGIFDDIASSPPSHAQLKQVIAGSSRSRANSVDTASSGGGDDLMLDYFDLEEAKAGGYEEEVLSPDASEIFSEWTAMMAEVTSAASVSERCVSREGSNSSGGGVRTPRPRLSSSSELSSPDPRRPTVLRPPRQSGGVTEVEGSGGGVFVDRTSYHYLCQDVTSLKTMLLRLRRVLQAADTINPFDANLRNSLYLSLAGGDSTVGSPGINGDKDFLVPSVNLLSQENVDLKRQVVLLQQQLQERDRTIRLLQQQLALSLQNPQAPSSGDGHGGGCSGTVATSPSEAATATASASTREASSCTATTTATSSNVATINAATQTDRSSRSSTLTGSSLSRAGSIDDGLGPTVSSEVERNFHHIVGNRGRSTSAPDHHFHQPRATSQPPGGQKQHFVIR